MALSPDLAAVLRIKNMAERAAADVQGETPGYGAAYEAAQAFFRLRGEARALVGRAGWSVDDFDREVPEPNLGELEEPSVTMNPRNVAVQGMALGPRTRVLLSQLAGWAAGHVEAFEIEARLKADADAKAAGARRGPTGFAR